LLWVLRALVRGAKLDPDRVRRTSGCALSDLEGLALRLKEAAYGALFYGPLLSRGPVPAATATVEAAFGLIRDLNSHTRFVILDLGGPGNTAGAEAVLAWQTGFPSGVDLGPGWPESVPGVTGASERLARGEADAALIVADPVPENLGPAALDHLARIPQVVIAPPEMTYPFEATVRLFSAVPGIDVGGTVTRTDGVSLPLRPSRSGGHLPSEREWLDALMTQWRPNMIK
jgi:formylmethanofuran dehydrogenase subunit B